MPRYKSPLAPVAIAALIAACSAGDRSTNSEWASLVTAIDSLVAEPLEEGKIAGASVAVVKGADTILLRGYGEVDLEYHIPTPDRAIYEIGSVTKQFTAAAILQLEELGKLKLDDDISKYLPDFPTQGNRITVRQLLDHTSGIKGYTEIPEARAKFTQKLSHDSLVAIFAREPFDFPTGTQMIYSNSAFFLAGMIIEKVSGASYAEYVEENLFDRAGMPDSRYCSENAVYENRAHGYDTDTSGTLVRKGFIDHSIPYAAGSLCSTAWDLVAWNQALHGGKILGPDAYEKMVSGSHLDDGTDLRYGLGIAVNEVAGRLAIHHGGGINGFLSESSYFPDEDLTVVALFNTAGSVGPASVVEAIADRMFGDPPEERWDFEGDLTSLRGTYKGVGRGNALEVTIAIDGEALTMTVGEGEPDTLVYAGNDTFSRGSARVTFERRGQRVTGMSMDQVYGYSKLRRVRDE